MSSFKVQMRGIRKSFGGVEILRGVDLDAAGGEVLALLGENGAGKSTLVKILSGDHEADHGTITIDGLRRDSMNPISAQRLGVRMIHQEFQDAGPLTVAENISLGRWPTRFGVVDWRTVNERAERVLDQLSVSIDPRATVSSLRVGERQIVEIARALAADARLLVFDEPTAALSDQEVTTLFARIRSLAARGTAVVFITHRLDEVTELADRVQVLRNGAVALNAAAADVTRRDIIAALVGHDVRASERKAAPSTGRASRIRLADVQLEAGSNPFTIDVHDGEVVCLYGKLGSGTTEVADLCFGLRQPYAGNIELSAAPVTLTSPSSAMRRGVGYLPADRKKEGAFLSLPSVQNLAIASWTRQAVGRWLLLRSRETATFVRWSRALTIRAHQPANTPIVKLSGGNQQKVLLARWLERTSNPLILVEPTRGVDVGARQDIYAAIRALADAGTAVLAVSSDYEEVLQIADRALVMSRGGLVEELRGDAITIPRLIGAVGG